MLIPMTTHIPGRLRCAASLLICFGLLSSVGCAFGARNIALEARDLGAGVSAELPPIQVMPFRDLRLEPQLGWVRNGYLQRTAWIHAVEPVEGWVRAVVVESLESAGLDAAGPEGSELSLHGEVLTVRVEGVSRYVADVALRLQLRRGDEVLLDRLYRDLGQEQDSQRKPRSYATALQVGLEAAVRRAGVDVVRVLREG